MNGLLCFPLRHSRTIIPDQHHLSLLYMVFAAGALTDLRQEASNAEAEHYYRIARAGVCLQPVLEEPSLVTAQVLYASVTATRGAAMSLRAERRTWRRVCRRSQRIFRKHLHRESARWGLSAAMVERRRILLMLGRASTPAGHRHFRWHMGKYRLSVTRRSRPETKRPRRNGIWNMDLALGTFVSRLNAWLRWQLVYCQRRRIATRH
ncbi:hypothetical protein FIBSPDRAFT_282609 [Athelia psychrophila]|uniref:Transcription factor domain-containing protein n=1 Tax=Athelia psychrophila TaxID=1759441 RepID=A0A166R2S6_9AGAM|nr:hypothetical protein FIBSPDRAFT_282609 [Fibularhizoctonia sp. CBS 109695]